MLLRIIVSALTAARRVRQLVETTVIATDMADPADIQHGMRAIGLDNTIRAPAILKKDNYRSWAMKLKAALKVMDCWRLVEGIEVAPPSTALVGKTAAETRAVQAAKLLWDKMCDLASAVLVTSISDEDSRRRPSTNMGATQREV